VKFAGGPGFHHLPISGSSNNILCCLTLQLLAH